MNLRDIGVLSRPRSAAAGICALFVLMGGCSSAYKVRIDNQTRRTLFAGIIEGASTGVAPRVIVNQTIAAGQVADFEGKPNRSDTPMSLLVGDSPSPGKQGRMFKLEKGKNEFTARQMGDEPRAPIVIEPSE